MNVNTGMIDRILRVLIGLILIVWAVGYLPGVAASAWGWIGVIPLLTGLVGYCPIYSIAGVNTCGRPSA